MEKAHSTNYVNTFIEIAADCPVDKAEVPPLKGQDKTVANLQFELISKHPYMYTSDDVIFTTHALKQDIPEPEWEHERRVFFSKGQPCLRSSPLTKRYGWGVHCNEEGKVAIYPMGSDEYQQFSDDKLLKKVKAMRSKRA